MGILWVTGHCEISLNPVDIPTIVIFNSPPPPPMATIRRVQLEEPHTAMGTSSLVEVTWIEVLTSPFTTRLQLCGHSSVLQVSVWVASPEHSAPPMDGAGLLHSLVRVLFPPPQVLLQEEKELQVPQPPSIAKKEGHD